MTRDRSRGSSVGVRRRAMWFLFVAAAASLWPAFGEAQWFTYPMRDIPRLASGGVDAVAPAPRTPDGRPDFSGVWLAGNHLPCPPLMRDGADCIEKIPLSAHARDIGTGVAGGLPLRPWAADVRRARTETDTRDDPHTKCLPSNVPRNYTLPHYQKFFQVPGVLVMLNEFNATFRQIFLDGRSLPPDPQPSWSGYSTARWEGDALVVDTTGLRDDLWLDMLGTPVTGAARLTERITRPTFGRLMVDLTVDDPKAYTRPWSVTVKHEIMLDTELIEFVCLENEQSSKHFVR